MKLVLVVVLCALAVVWADNKAGHLSQGGSESPLSAIPAFAAAVLDAAAMPSAAAPTPVEASSSSSTNDEAADGGFKTFVIDLKLNEPQPDSDESETNPMESSMLPSFPLFRFGPNPTARHLRRPEPVVLSEMPPTPLEADAPPAKGGIFGAICGGIMDALFGPPIVPVPLPPPVADPLVTSNGWFNVRPSSFFSSFLGPSPSEAMANSGDDDNGKTTIFTSSSSTSAGPMIFTITSRRSSSPLSSTSDEDASAEEPTPLLAVPPSPGAELEDAGMHRIGGRSRLGKLFNRVMRFLHLRPPREFEAPQQTADDEASTSDDEEQPPSDDQPTSVDEQTDTDTDTDGDDDTEVTTNSDDDEQAGGNRWRRWRDHHRRHRGRGRGRWGHWRRNHRACKRDVRRLCPERDGGFMGAVRCVLDHPNDLSTECKEHLRFSREFSCAHDAVKLCPNAETRRELKRCMFAHRSEVSEQCKVAISAHRKHHAVPDTNTATQTPDVPSTPTPVPTPTPTPAPSDVTPKVPAAEPKGPVIAIELQTTPNAKPDFEYSGAAKPAPAPSSTSTTAATTASSSTDWFASRRATVTNALHRLPKWALALIAALAAISLIGIVACAVVTCRRSRAAACEAAAKAPRLVVGAPAQSAVQFANVAGAPVQPVKSQGAAAIAEPLLSVKVAAV